MPFIYADDLTVNIAFKLLISEPSARLIDVRTKTETIFSGIPDLSNLPNGKNFQNHYCLIEWKSFLSMDKNDKFIITLNSKLNTWQKQDNIDKQDRRLLFLCRSGNRSAFAANVATQLGCIKSYNLIGGFEGNINNNNCTKTSNWKFMRLPWSK